MHSQNSSLTASQSSYLWKLSRWFTLWVAYAMMSRWLRSISKLYSKPESIVAITLYWNDWIWVILIIKNIVIWLIKLLSTFSRNKTLIELWLHPLDHLLWMSFNIYICINANHLENLKREKFSVFLSLNW